MKSISIAMLFLTLGLNLYANNTPTWGGGNFKKMPHFLSYEASIDLLQNAELKLPHYNTQYLSGNKLFNSNKVTIGSNETWVIAPGTTLTFAPGATLEIRGRLMGMGSSESPIVMQSADPNKKWEGLRFIGSGRIFSIMEKTVESIKMPPNTNILKYVVIRSAGKEEKDHMTFPIEVTGSSLIIDGMLPETTNSIRSHNSMLFINNSTIECNDRVALWADYSQVVTFNSLINALNRKCERGIQIDHSYLGMITSRIISNQVGILAEESRLNLSSTSVNAQKRPIHLTRSYLDLISGELVSQDGIAFESYGDNSAYIERTIVKGKISLTPPTILTSVDNLWDGQHTVKRGFNFSVNPNDKEDSKKIDELKSWLQKQQFVPKKQWAATNGVKEPFDNDTYANFFEEIVLSSEKNNQLGSLEKELRRNKLDMALTPAENAVCLIQNNKTKYSLYRYTTLARVNITSSDFSEMNCTQQLQRDKKGTDEIRAIIVKVNTFLNSLTDNRLSK